jgi:phi13 family phage major tail protein
MAKTGLKHVVGAPLKTDGRTYNAGMVLGKAIAASISVEISEVLLYGDDSVCESIKEFKTGKISLNTDDLTYPVQGLLLGHTVTENTLVANANDVAPEVGVGFYGSVIRGGTTKYRAVWLNRCKFAEPSDESKTKGENIEFSTPTCEGTIMKRTDGQWKEEEIFTTETAAVTWLDGKAGISAGVIEDDE